MNKSIFENEVSQSAVQTIRETMSVSLDDDGVALVSFAMNRGKGSGAQVMAVSDFSEYVATLEHYASNGIDEIPTDNLSPAETVRQTINLDDDGVISFRVRSGKGAKPAKVSADEFTEVASLLGSTLEAVQGAASQLSGTPQTESDEDTIE
jgi:hypothetical protein|tara:strand:+ start:2810 stop:3262 length:453 start_codon:yes stop_codon:yes gene_type:complete